MSNNKLSAIKIGLDFHGVINGRPQYFATFSQEAFHRGHEIHIITGGPYQVVKQMLENWGVCYTKIFAIMDFYETTGEIGRFENGEYKIPNKLWDMAKAEYCAVNGINIHIDDSSVYAKWFTTPYCHYESEKKQCSSVNGIKIDFGQHPSEAIKAIEQMVTALQFY